MNVLNKMDSSSSSQPEVVEESTSDKIQSNNYPTNWRHGPASLWYDMLGIPLEEETLDYGFKLREDDNLDSRPENEFSEDAFHLVTQLNWESNIIWDGKDPKELKNFNHRLSKPWTPGNPTGLNRLTYNYSQSDTTNSHSSSSTPVSVVASTTTTTPQVNSQKVNDMFMTGQDDGTWNSIFPMETEELVHGRWEDEVIWDIDAVKTLPTPKVLSISPLDDDILLCIPEDTNPNPVPTAQSAPPKAKIPHSYSKKSKILLSKAGVINIIQVEEETPVPTLKNEDKDPYNISNDEYYQSVEQPSFSSTNMIRHSTPVLELQPPFIPTHLSENELRNFHRPPLTKKLSIGSHPVLSLSAHIKKKAKAREKESCGGGDIFFMKTSSDLTGKDGELLIFEYCEEHPPLLSQAGMCSKIKNYYKRKVGKDSGPPEKLYGETTFAHLSPFLGTMQPGQCIQTIENNLYRAPVYPHQIRQSDFLLIRTSEHYFIREFDAIFTVGQQCPLYEVPMPNSARAKNFIRDFLQVFIYRLFGQSRAEPQEIKMDDVKSAFPTTSNKILVNKLKVCADPSKRGTKIESWILKPEFRLPREEELQRMITPEECCSYFSLIAAQQRLKDAGYGEKLLLDSQEANDDAKLEHEIKLAPWNTTRAYIQASKGKCLLEIVGKGDPTGCGEGFSYIRAPIRTQEVAPQPKKLVAGTDGDLRKLSITKAKNILRTHGLPEKKIKKLNRLEAIDVVRTLSNEKVKAGEKGMTKYSRGSKTLHSKERYKMDCQHVFELQNTVLSSNEVLSTDDEDATEKKFSDIEEMGKDIENILSHKKSTGQVNFEREEQERRLLKNSLLKGQNKKDDKKKKNDDVDATTTSKLNGLIDHPQRILKISRTYMFEDGREETKTEIVRDPTIIDIYIKIRTERDENFIRQFVLQDQDVREELKKEKSRLQGQLRRIKNRQKKEIDKSSDKPKGNEKIPLLRFKLPKYSDAAVHSRGQKRKKMESTFH